MKKKIRLHEPGWVSKTRLSFIDQILAALELRRYERYRVTWERLANLKENDHKHIAVYKNRYWIADDNPTLFALMRADCIDDKSAKELRRRSFMLFNSNLAALYPIG